MCELKFRLFWEGKFYYWGFLDDGDGMYFAAPICGGERLTFKDAQQRSQQFTGLKDKNGVEIYEGDILQTPKTPHLTVDRMLFEAVWGDDRYTDPMPEFILVPINSKSGGHSRFQNLWKGSPLWPLEVIGNIYENHEILETPDAPKH